MIDIKPEKLPYDKENPGDATRNGYKTGYKDYKKAAMPCAGMAGEIF